MPTNSIIRAWKDPKYRATLTPEQLAALPTHPSGMPLAELGEDELRGVVGGNTANTHCQCVTAVGSCGHICTYTTECPFLTLLCC
ncbi:MAG: mersacidin/lichenicidin family type 2 lantibiotic [Chloroflexota bacterium]|nr:mersacidin/lichenicidin family type 2 lantibiotic [Chloroflexota bacterium]